MKTFSEADGHQLAADLLREMGADYARRADAMEAGAPDGLSEEKFTLLCKKFWSKHRSPILRRYLSMVSDRNSPELSHGFYAVLSDILGSYASADAGGEAQISSIESYEPDWQSEGAR